MGFFSKVKDAVSGSAGSLIGSAISGGLGLIGTANKNAASMDVARMNAAMQKEFAQNSIRWRVEDAKRAGVHPMAALGINASSFSPVQPVLESPDFSFLSDMGQSVDRAAMVAKDQEARKAAQEQTDAVNALTLERMGLENDILRQELASKQSVARTALPPAAPPVNPKMPAPTGSPSLPPTGLVSPKESAYHVWKMGDNLYDINLNPDYQATIGDEFGQVINAIKSAGRPDVWVNPHDGVAYVYDPDSGYFMRLSAMSAEEADRYLGRIGVDAPHFDPARYAQTFYVGF